MPVVLLDLFPRAVAQEACDCNCDCLTFVKPPHRAQKQFSDGGSQLLGNLRWTVAPQVAGRQLHSQSLLQARSAQLATRTGDAEADTMKPRSTNCGESECFEEQSLWKNNNDNDNETDHNTERTKRTKSREGEQATGHEREHCADAPFFVFLPS